MLVLSCPVVLAADDWEDPQLEILLLPEHSNVSDYTLSRRRAYSDEHQGPIEQRSITARQPF